MQRECLRCLLLESAQQDMLLTIQQHIAKIPAKEKAPEELYRERLRICCECDNLLSGVCRKCGCYPEFRAAFLRQKCPDTKPRKW